MFSVFVADNFHYMDESETYKLGEFSTWPAAVTAARAIVDRFLLDALRTHTDFAALYQNYLAFGDDPYIIPQPVGERFSAWEYAQERCGHLCPSSPPRNNAQATV